MPVTDRQRLRNPERVTGSEGLLALRSPAPRLAFAGVLVLLMSCTPQQGSFGPLPSVVPLKEEGSNKDPAASGANPQGNPAATGAAPGGVLPGGYAYPGYGAPGIPQGSVSFPEPTGPMVLSSLNPAEGSSQGGTYLAAVGSNFSDDTTILVGGTLCPVVARSPVSILCLTPAGSPGDKSVVAVRPSDGTSATFEKPFVYFAPAVASSVAPNFVSSLGGQRVTLTGAGLRSGSMVKVGGIDCRELTIVNSNTLTCAVPAMAAGTYDLELRGSDGQASLLSQALTVLASPEIASVTPSSVPAAAGGQITIAGSHFGSGSTVTVGGASCGIVSSTDAEIKCNVAGPWPRSESVDLVVTTGQGLSVTRPGGLAYQMAPSLRVVLPAVSSSSGGQEITLFGDGFVSGIGVQLGSSACTPVVRVSSSELRCTTPAGSGTVALTVTNPDGQLATLAGGFRYSAPPTFVSLSPSSGPAAGGQLVTITGSGFQEGAQVSVGGALCQDLSVLSATSIRCRPMAASAGSKSLVITNPDQQSVTAVNAYTQVAAPSLASVTPSVASSLGGTVLTLAGNNFASGALVSISGAPCSNVTFVSSTQITCEAPSGSAGSRFVAVTNPDLQVGSLANAVTYKIPPQIFGILPVQGPSTGGTRLTISGSGFDTVDPLAITVGGGACTNVAVTNSTEVQCDAPAGSGSATVVITHADGLKDQEVGGFLYYDPIALTSVSPSSGSNIGGTLITLSGTGFYPGTAVLMDGVPCQSITVVNAGTLTCVTPPHAPGAATLAVQSVYAGSANLTFTYQALGGELLASVAGSHAEAKLGSVLAAAGDVTGTTVTDLLAAAPGQNLAGTGRGSVSLFDGFSRVKARETGVTEVNNRFGQVLASGGDITGDGKLDLLVGEPYAACGGTERGRVTAYASSSGGAVWSKLFSVCGDADNARFGWSLAFTGDSDLDTFNDFVVGAPNHPGSGSNQGRVYIYSGRTGRLIQLLRTGGTNERCGFGVASGYDTTGDSIPDVALICGGTSSFYTHSIRSPFSGITINAGVEPTSVSMLRDVNGSGRAEIVVGKPTQTDNWSGVGVMSLYDGGSGAGLCSVLGYSHLGFTNVNVNMSRDVFVIGDILADNEPHILMSAWTHEYGNGKGYFRVVKASSSGQCVIAASGTNRTATGNQTAGNLGRAIGGGFDVNGDGRSDYIVGEPYIDQSPSLPGRGRVVVYSGSDGALLHNIAGPEQNAGFGLAVSLIADQDGDGKSEIAVGAPSRTVNGVASRGQVTIYKGGETGGGVTQPTVLAQLSGESDHIGFGAAVAGGLDFTGDGISDYLVGEPETRGNTRGQVNLYSGSNGNLVTQVSGVSNGGRFGAAVEILSDIRNASNAVGTDARSEFAVAAPSEGSNQEGRVYLFNGSSQAEITSWTETRAQGEFGFALGRLRHDTDTTLDLAVGQPGGVASPGSVHIFNGSSLNRACLRHGEQDLSRFGASIVGLGDLNGDGRDDYAVGAPEFNGLGTKRGKVYVYAGADASCGALLFSITGTEDDALFGTALAAADVNNDTKMDLIVGAPKAAAGGVRRGEVRVYSGNPANYGTQLLANNGYVDDSMFGASLVSLGNTDAAGAAHDFIVGAPAATMSSLLRAGAVYFFRSTLD